MKNRIAVIGAGISGIYVAKELSKFAQVTVFEKSRGFGGRMSTRTRDDFEFDHGAQYFTVKSNEFNDFLLPYIDTGIICRWLPKMVCIENGHSHDLNNSISDTNFYVPLPKMNSFCRFLASGLEVHLETMVDKISKEGKNWILYQGDKILGKFDWVVCAIPSNQVVQIIPDSFVYKNDVSKIKMQGCYSLMLGFNSPLNINWDAANINGSSIGWVAVNSIKPKRTSKYSVIAQTTNLWAESNIESDQEEVKKYLLEQLSGIINADLSSAVYTDLHRWRYANSDKKDSQKSFVDLDSRLAACGDWCIEGRVEAAFLSAYNLVGLIKEKLE
jgi:renalase